MRTTVSILMAASVLLTACVPARDAHVRPASQPARSGAEGQGETPSRRAARLLDTMDELYQEAADAHRRNEPEAVAAKLDALVLAFLQAPPDVSGRVEVRESFENLLAMGRSLETPDPGGVADMDAVLLEGLEDLSTFLPADVAASSRYLIGDEPMRLTIPVPLNNEVLSFVNYFTNKGKGTMERGLGRSSRYIQMIRTVFREEGVPEELAYLALVESSYQPKALSRAGARGLWQFMPGTGRRYGLNQDLWVDERCDFEKATRAAARYLKDLHGMFGDWHLAMASYNCGEGRVQRALARSGGNGDFWTLYQKNLLPRETRNYVPAILAAILIGTEPQRYGVSPEALPPVQWEELTVDAQTDLSVCARLADRSVEEFLDLNPELRAGVTPAGMEAYTVRVPLNTAGLVNAGLDNLSAEERMPVQYHVVRRGETLNGIARQYGISRALLADANGLRRSKSLSTGQRLMIPKGAVYAMAVRDQGASAGSARTAKRYKVRKGDTLGTIASRNGVSVKNLCRANGLSTRSTIHPGQVLRIPGKYVSQEPVETANRQEPARERETPAAGTCVVARGDTLSGIASRHGVSLNALCAANGLSTRSVLKPGQKLQIPGGGDAPASSPSEQARSNRTHKVQRGDTLFEIAQRYGTTIEVLCRLNRIDQGHTLYPGERIRLP